MAAVVAIASYIHPKPALGEIRSEILSPRPGSKYPEGYKITFSGRGFDPSFGELGDADLSWNSNRGNIIGSGKRVAFGNLPVGPNRVTLTATNAAGRTAAASTDLIITPAAIHMKKLQDLPCVGDCKSIASWDGWMAVASADKDNLSQTNDRVILYAIQNDSAFRRSAAVQIARPNRVLYSAGLSYVASATGLIDILRVSNEGEIQNISSIRISSPASILDMYIQDDLLVARTSLGHSFLVDIGNPDRPSVVSEITKGAQFQGGAAIRGNVLFLANRYNGFNVFGIHDRTAPIELATLAGTMNDFSTNIEISGDFAYVGSGAGNFKSIYIGDAMHPNIIGTLDQTGNSVRIQKKKNFVYLASVAQGLQVIDVENPSMPTFAAASYEYGNIYNVSISEDMLILCAGKQIIVLKIEE